MKTANQILYDHGIATLELDDKFNSQLFAAMEAYASQFKSSETLLKQGDQPIKCSTNDLWITDGNAFYKSIEVHNKAIQEGIQKLHSVAAVNVNKDHSLIQKAISELENLKK